MPSIHACISFGTLAEPMSWGSLLQSKITLLFNASRLARVFYFEELASFLISLRLELKPEDIRELGIQNNHRLLCRNSGRNCEDR
jgi:hypothetical protein